MKVETAAAAGASGQERNGMTGDEEARIAQARPSVRAWFVEVV